jgi:DNA-binding NtrC family response regulator
MKKIVIADDDKAFLSSLADVLKIENASYDILCAENGAQAEIFLHTFPVDLLITDLRMPVMGGAELMRYAAGNNPDMPVIVVSACTDAKVLNEFSRKNYHFFDKPIMIKDLVSMVRSLLDN